MNHNGTNDLPLHTHNDGNGLDYTLQASVYSSSNATALSHTMLTKESNNPVNASASYSKKYLLLMNAFLCADSHDKSYSQF